MKYRYMNVLITICLLLVLFLCGKHFMTQPSYKNTTQIAEIDEEAKAVETVSDDEVLSTTLSENVLDLEISKEDIQAYINDSLFGDAISQNTIDYFSPDELEGKPLSEEQVEAFLTTYKQNTTPITTYEISEQILGASGAETYSYTDVFDNGEHHIEIALFLDQNMDIDDPEAYYTYTYIQNPYILTAGWANEDTYFGMSTQVQLQADMEEYQFQPLSHLFDLSNSLGSLTVIKDDGFYLVRKVEGSDTTDYYVDALTYRPYMSERYTAGLLNVTTAFYEYDLIDTNFYPSIVLNSVGGNIENYLKPENVTRTPNYVE